MGPSATSLALSNLRAYVILIVLGFHSILAYLGSLSTVPQRFDAPPYDWRSFPIIDSQRWYGFDIFCAWHDLYLMSLMFFVSGLFVWPSLVRKGTWKFLSDRLLRLGLPLLLAVYVLMPVALYPAYRVRAAEPSLSDFWRQWMSLPAWPCGPQWFLWQLLALNVAAAALHRFVPGADRMWRRTAAWAAARPLQFLLALLALSAAAYVPLAVLFTPWKWFEIGPFAFQYSRPLHYLVYFLAGVALGSHGLERGLLAVDGILPQHWRLSLAGAMAGLLAWMIPTAIIYAYYAKPGPWLLQLAADCGFVLGCAGGAIFMLSLVLRFAKNRTRMIDSLSQNAYGMYLVHYVFVVWLQYWLLGAALPAVIKAALVLGATVLLSWGATVALSNVPLGSRVIGARTFARAP